MFDTMTMTKIVGGFCGMLLVFLLGNWAAEIIYHGGAGGHGEHHEQAYSIETGEQDDDGGGEAVAAVEEVDFSIVYAAADSTAGERLFRACKACHRVEDGANGTGPHLFGVVGRNVSSVGGFSYSGNLIAVADVWTPENLNGFLENPKEFAPGTRMVYKGMPDIEDRANLIAWLASVGG